MRFAYIDSQGNQVAIPSVEALGLRIELGAIGPDTQLYDGQTDRWGPASSHEIFQTLSRGVAERSYPAPPVAPKAGETAPVDSGPEGTSLPRDDAAKPSQAATPEEAEPLFDLTDEFTPAMPAPDRSPPGGATTPEEAEPLFELTDGLTPAMPAPKRETSEEGTSHTGTEPTFDLASEFEPPQADEAPVGKSDLLSDLEPRETADDDLRFDLTLLDTGEMVGGDEDAQWGAAAGGSEDGVDLPGSLDLAADLDLEPPLSALTHEAVPSGAGPERLADEGEAMLFGSGRPEPPEEIDRRAGAPTPIARDRGRRERPTPRNRPSPPRRVKKRSTTGLIVGFVVVAVVAGGGWLGWRWYQNRGAGGPEAAATAGGPGVTIPEIPAELLPKMRDLGETALAATIDRMRGMVDSLHLAAAPDSDWLAGVYMANAGRYADVHDYWAGLKLLVDSVRAEDAHLFHDEFRKQVAAASLKGDTARILLERADSGFLATRQDREAAYTLMDNLVMAALDLHQFLTDNESEIEYDPAAGGVSRDPVLEAVPKTKALGTEMWSRVDRITAALDALGTLDKVTTERLTTVLFDRIRRAGFQ